MKFIEYKTRNLKGAYLYVPENVAAPLPLVVWLTGGNDGAQLPLKFSLGKLLDKGERKPNCAVLMPAASYGHNYTTMGDRELYDLIAMASSLFTIDRNNISLCGWSLGADAAAILTEECPGEFDRVCLISNYPKVWKGGMPGVDLRILVGANEASSRRNWGNYPVERIPGYGHEIGEKIWLDKSVDLLGWLTGEKEE